MAEERNLGELTLVTDEGDDVVMVAWLGKSTASAPGDVLAPVLLEAADRAAAGKKRLTSSFAVFNNFIIHCFFAPNIFIFYIVVCHRQSKIFGF